MIDLPEKYVEDRYRNRRAMAWLSVFYCLIMGVVLVVFGLRSSENAAILVSLTAILAGIFGVPTAIVLSYFTSTTITDITGFKK